MHQSYLAPVSLIDRSKFQKTKIFIILPLSHRSKRVTNGGVHLRGVAPGQHISKETSQRWRSIGCTVSNLTGPKIEPLTSRAKNKVFNSCANFLVKILQFFTPKTIDDNTVNYFLRLKLSYLAGNINNDASTKTSGMILVTSMNTSNYCRTDLWGFISNEL